MNLNYKHEDYSGSSGGGTHSNILETVDKENLFRY
jgi:hypothetical protein